MKEVKNIISLNGKNFTVLDEINNIGVVDSFVKVNKIGRGSGEARLYVGSQKNGIDYTTFFDGFTHKCFFVKKDFEDYLNDAKFEYEEQEQGYKKDISENWPKYVEELKDINDIEYFDLENATGDKDASRFYIRSYDNIFRDFFRKIALPTITYISILKLKEESENEIYYYFKPTLDYFYNPFYHPAKIREEEENIKKDKKLKQTQKDQIVKARIGQGEYRKKLLEESTECIITKVNDERILIASHIKPWSVCDDVERTDHNNGLLLTPTYDRLFDQGFISFKNDGAIIISPYISPLNIKKLSLAPNRKYVLPESEKRKEYLEYHRANIFKK